MMPPQRSLSSLLFGIAKGEAVKKEENMVGVQPLLKLEADKKVYRPGDPVTITVEIRNPPPPAQRSLLVETLSFQATGIQKLDTQWFTTTTHNHNRRNRRGEYVFMDSSVPSLVSNQLLSPGATRTYILRMNLPTVIPPSYRGSTVRYLYHVKSVLSGKYLNMDDGHPHGGFSAIEARLPLQIWVTEKTNGLLNEETGSNGIVPATPILLDVYWKDMDAESEWARANETLDGVEDDYESQRDDVSSVSSFNPARGSLQKAFGSSLSLQSRSSKEVPYHDQKSTISSYMPLSTAEVLYGSTEDILSPRRVFQNEPLGSSNMEDDYVTKTVEPVA